jgi:hypothetical protein
MTRRRVLAALALALVATGQAMAAAVQDGAAALIEQSAYFTRATFFAPTTRSPSQSGDNFHIEAQIQPVFAPSS